MDRRPPPVANIGFLEIKPMSRSNSLFSFDKSVCGHSSGRLNVPNWMWPAGSYVAIMTPLLAVLLYV